MKPFVPIIISIVASLTLVGRLNAQTYEIDNFNGQTVNTCSGTFYDSGGQFGFYGNNESYTITICPNTANSAIRVDFTQFSLGSGDQLCVFDGINTLAPSFGCFSNAVPASAAQASSTNTTRCLTFTFTSNGTNTGSGWAGAISCVLPCQTVLSDLASSTPAPVPLVNGYIDVCPGDLIQLSGQGVYPQNNTFYNQQDATSTFEWVIEGQSYSGQNVSYSFANPGGYRIQLNITDTLGCENTNFLNQRVRVAEDPSFDGTMANDTILCIGDTATLIGEVIPPIQVFAPPLSRGDSLFLPDGVGVCYQTTLEFNDFNVGQTITSLSDLISICVNMEHSYMGDLNIQVECPNGQTVTLHQYSGGGGTYLGEPIDIDTDLSPGLGYDYCWTPTASQTWTQAVATGNTINVNGSTTLPPGNYASSQPLSGLIGCPLNGVWEIEICDNLAIDNGYIFSWGIQFDPSIYPSLDSFAAPITLQQWNNHPSVIANQGDTIITVVPTSPGAISYTFSADNGSGCSYDTTISLTVLPFTDPTCFNCDTLQIPPQSDVTICNGDSTSLDATVTTTAFDDLAFSNIGSFAVPTNSFIDIPIPVSGVTANTVANGSIVSVCLDIDHVITQDLDIFLVAPNGASLELTTDNGTGSDFTNTCFTPAAATNITAGSNPYTGNFQPEGNWASLNGANINGTWALRVRDDSPGFDGTLNSIEITFANPYIVAYSWSPATGLSCTNCPDPTATPTTTTTYVVTATDNYGCAKTDSVTVNVTPAPSAPVVTCDSLTASFIRASWLPVANASGYEIFLNGTWQPVNGVNSHTFSGLSPSQVVQYSIRSIGTSGCIGQSVLMTCTTLACDLAITLDSIQDVSCSGLSDGVIYTTATSSSATINYLINGADPNGTISNVAAGTYNVIVTDGFGCADSVQAIINQPTEITPTTVVTAVLCNDSTDGSATVTALGGAGGYSFAWNTNPTQNTATASNLSAGTYIVTITDASNCTTTDTAIVTEPTALSISLDKTDAICYQANDGKAWVTPSGGTAPYTYQWNTTPAQFADTALALVAGTYVVSVADANNCLTIDSITINEPAPLQLNMDSTDLSCFGAMDGTATVAVTGGSAPYSYQWSTSPIQTSATADSLAVGSYTVTVTDVNGCSNTATITVNQPTQITATFNVSQVTCFGLADGTATVFPTGGAGGYSYQWQTQPVQPTPTITGLTGGDYSVLITDADGCSNTQTVNVFAPVLINIFDMDSTPVTCFGDNDGTVLANAAGGSGSLTYTWSNNGVGNTQTGLTAGMYSLTVSDVIGCIGVDSIEVASPDSITFSFARIIPSCFGDANGSITASAAGGTSPYNYQWNTSPVQDSATLINVGAGLYDVTATDANGCTNTDTVRLLQPDSIALNMSSTPASCFGDADGTATVAGTGGQGNLYYIWNNDPTLNTATISGLTAGIYQVVVRDDVNCSNSDTVSVLQPMSLTSTDTSVQTGCFGDSTGFAVANAMGGNGGYSYIWNTNPVQSADTAIDLAGGTYIYTITDSKNCTYIDSVTVDEPQPLATITSAINISCYNANDGIGIVTPAGGTAPFSYNWNSTAQTDSLVTGLSEGWHYVTVTDAFGCLASDSVQIDNPDSLTIAITGTDVLCNGGNTGTAITTITGGTGAYNYLWSDSSTAANPTNLMAGWNVVTVTDVNNCTIIDSIQTGEPLPLNAAMTATPVNCYNGSDGTATATMSGGTAPYSYVWNTSPIQNAPTATGLNTGTYIVIVTDTNNCIISDTVFVAEPNAPLVASITDISPSCHNTSDGALTATVVGGTPDAAGGYKYDWSNGQTTATATGLAGGTYTVTITDANNCLLIETFELLAPTPIVTIITPQAASCFEGNDGQAFAASSGATPSPGNTYSYIWNTTPTQTSELAIGLTGGQTYIVTVTDANGCTNTDSVTIDHPDQLFITPITTNVTCNGFADGTAAAQISGGTPPFQFQWDANAGNQTTSSINNLDIGMYSITVTDIAGCETDTQMTITEPTPLSIVLFSEDVICKGENTGIASAQVAGGTPWYTFDWSANANNSTNSVVENLFAGTYSVTATDGNGCEISDSIEILEPEIGLTAIYQVQDVSCFGRRDGRMNISVTGGFSPYQYSLDGVNYNAANALAGLSAGDYQVYVQDELGCIVLDTVTVDEPDQIIVDLGEDLLINAGDRAPIVPTITNGQIPYLYNWTPNDSSLSCYTCPVPVVETLMSDQQYFLTVTDANGCVGADDIFVRIQQVREVYVATGFTPNGDGTNDYLYVQGGDNSTLVVSFQVYDRWGELVFEAADTPLNQGELGWDGTFRGQKMNAGVYGWRAEIQFADGETLLYEGNATLIR